MSETPPKPKPGDIIERLGQMWEVVDVCPIWTPYRRRWQDTKVEGWCMALREHKPSDPLSIVDFFDHRHGPIQPSGMNWPTWMLPIIIPIWFVYYVKMWLVEGVLRDNDHWNDPQRQHGVDDAPRDHRG